MIIIVQPWLSANGHPAQSLINLAQIVGRQNNILYLVSEMKGNKPIEEVKDKLTELGEVKSYTVSTSSLREGTLKALKELKKLFLVKPATKTVFFLDAHLVLLSIFWPFFSNKKIKTLGVVYLLGPEKISKYFFIKQIVRLFLKRNEVKLFLRTKELVTDWKVAFPEANVKCLPSLEIPVESTLVADTKVISKTIRLGVLGQIRVGKSLEWLVPLFKKSSSLGVLTVAGAFSQSAERQRFEFLEKYEGFQEKYLNEEELLKLASEQDYLLMLYDNWDHRMEGAVMFLAARVNVPVIVFDKGWCGRMINTYGNGVLAPLEVNKFEAFVKTLPLYGSGEYKELRKGVAKFKEAHSGASIKDAFLKAMII